ncbi:MAG: DUF3108 domain-containing protein [Muribaculaceae bacterium]|nr:DUF3108 domain-containing protein [Muribaculaceae bacterium]
MKKIFLLTIAIAGLILSPAINALSITNETLNYQVVYHWGIVWKHAGDATLTTTKTASGYSSRLTGKTRSWADKVYPVRDTLKCTMTSNFRPLKYEKFTHEKSYYAHDIVEFSNYGASTSAKCTRYRKNKPTANLSLTANGVAYDMLSVFFMLRNIDFEKMKSANTYSTWIFSGKQKEILTIKYVGIKGIELRDKSKHLAYHIKLKFTQDNGKKSSDDIDAYISTDDQRIPLMVVGKLPVGEIKCYYAR